MELNVAKHEQRKILQAKRREYRSRTVAAAGLLDLSSGSQDPCNTQTPYEDLQPEDTCESSDLNVLLSSDASTQTDLSYADISGLEAECQQLRNEVHHYRSVANAANFNQGTFRDDDEKVKFCTGLPSYAVLMVVFENIYQHFKETHAVSKFQQLMITLIKIRLDVPFQFLAYIFGLHTSSVSRIFQDVINVMNVRLVPVLVFWPNREELRKTIPMSFREKFSKCACIIDCFEVFIQRPSDLQARADTYSQYKSHNTVKYLIGIAPQGVITFISRGWGGRTSDVYLTENCGFLNNLLPGDVILADRGFTVSESVAFYNAELKIPAFTKGKQQLSALDVETSRVLASVRIHVERVIGVTRQKYSMLEGTIPITFLQCDSHCKLTTLDKIVRVACALTNLSPSCVPIE